MISSKRKSTATALSRRGRPRKNNLSENNIRRTSKRFRRPNTRFSPNSSNIKRAKNIEEHETEQNTTCSSISSESTSSSSSSLDSDDEYIPSPKKLRKMHLKDSKISYDEIPSDAMRDFIQAVRKCPVIWDRQITSHGQLINIAWAQLKSELDYFCNWSITEFNNLWKHLTRFYFNLVITGSFKEWKYNSDMSFLRQSINFQFPFVLKPTVISQSNIQCETSDSQNALMFVLKQINDSSKSGEHLMKNHQDLIDRILSKNYSNTLGI